jgi:hypothetical protein
MRIQVTQRLVDIGMVTSGTYAFVRMVTFGTYSISFSPIGRVLDRSPQPLRGSPQKPGKPR